MVLQLVVLVDELVLGLPERFPPLAGDLADGGTPVVGKGVGGREVDPAVGADVVAYPTPALVAEDLDVLLKFEELLADVGYELTAGVGGSKVVGQGSDLEGEGEGVAHG